MDWIRDHTLWLLAFATTASVVVSVLAMSLARSDRTVSRRLPHTFALSDPQFRRELSVLLGPPVLEGNAVTALQNGAEIFPAMLGAIAGAERSITFETYIYWSGAIGKAFSDALAAKARAGVPVHVTIDWAGSVKLEQSMLDEMIAAGVRVQRYRPLSWHDFGRFNNRTHRKLLIVDGRIAFTGGVGIADQWQGSAGDPDHWRDSHFRLEGPAAAQFQAGFIDNWMKTTGEVLSGDAYFPALPPCGALAAQLFIASPAGGSESMHLMYLMAISASERSIELAASYFVPDVLMLEALVAAAARGVRVRILLPGPHIDAETVRIASMGAWGPLLSAGVEIAVYQPTMLHTKLLVVDTLLVSVGSTNFDLRSFRLNDEASLNVLDTTFATEMSAVFARDLIDARPFTLAMWRARPMRQRIAERLLAPFRSQM